MNEFVTPLRKFLRTPTPDAWCRHAATHLDVLLLDHANCEMKAAQTALSLVYRYPERGALCQKLSRLAREELRHYEQVQRWLDRLGIERRKLGPARYAAGLLAQTTETEPQRLYQRLLVGALIEARSCERFAALLDYLPTELAAFYGSLLASEARHYRDYLDLAADVAGTPADGDGMLATLLDTEAELISRPDDVFRFHSGVPASASVDAETPAVPVEA